MLQKRGEGGKGGRNRKERKEEQGEGGRREVKGEEGGEGGGGRGGGGGTLPPLRDHLAMKHLNSLCFTALFSGNYIFVSVP